MRSDSIQGLLMVWRRCRALCYALSAVGVILGALAAGWFWSVPSLGVVLIAIVDLIAIGYHRYHTKPDLSTLTAIVNQQHPELEYSGSLLTARELNPLQELQRDKVAALFEQKNFTLSKPIGFCLATPIITALAMWSLSLFSHSDDVSTIAGATALGEQYDSYAEETAIHDSVSITGVDLYADYPAYTNKVDQRSERLDLSIPEGTNMTWAYKMTGQPIQSFMIFSDGDTIALKNQRRLSRSFKKSDNYRYGYQDRYQRDISDYHSIEVLKDQAPRIEISGIDEYLRLDWAPDHRVSFDMDINDDYGLACLLYTSPSPRDATLSRMPSSA